MGLPEDGCGGARLLPCPVTGMQPLGVPSPASGGASSPASGGAAYNNLLRILRALVKRVHDAMAARPLLTYPQTKMALEQLTVALESEFRTRRGRVHVPTCSGASGHTADVPNKAMKKRKPCTRSALHNLQRMLRRSQWDQSRYLKSISPKLKFVVLYLGCYFISLFLLLGG